MTPAARRSSVAHQPGWYTPADASTWERVKEALRRDWVQTKHDLHVGGHELNQKIADTTSQVGGSEAIPAIDTANPPKVIGRWEDVEAWIGFGYACKTHYGVEYPDWTDDLASKLKADWKGDVPWSKVELYVRHGYEAPHI